MASVLVRCVHYNKYKKEANLEEIGLFWLIVGISKFKIWGPHLSGIWWALWMQNIWGGKPHDMPESETKWLSPTLTSITNCPSETNSKRRTPSENRTSFWTDLLNIVVGSSFHFKYMWAEESNPVQTIAVNINNRKRILGLGIWPTTLAANAMPTFHTGVPGLRSGFSTMLPINWCVSLETARDHLSSWSLPPIWKMWIELPVSGRWLQSFG